MLGTNPGLFKIKMETLQELEKWLSSEECLLLVQGTSAWSLALPSHGSALPTTLGDPTVLQVLWVPVLECTYPCLQIYT